MGHPVVVHQAFVVGPCVLDHLQTIQPALRVLAEHEFARRRGIARNREQLGIPLLVQNPMIGQADYLSA
ncbi:hypothetical protein D3C76_1781470 [compost metagenome]